MQRTKQNLRADDEINMEKETIAQRAARLAGQKPADVQTEKSPKVAKNGKNYIRKGVGNGGARPGAGGPPRGAALGKRAQRQLIDEFGAEEIEVEIIDRLSGKRVKVKKSRTVLATEALFNIGMGFAQKGNGQDLERFINRVVGKPAQPIVGDEDEAPLAVDLGVDRLLDKAYGDDTEKTG